MKMEDVGLMVAFAFSALDLLPLFFFSLQFYGLHSQLQIIWATYVCFILLYFRLYE
jgi:hypothetical protein